MEIFDINNSKDEVITIKEKMTVAKFLVEDDVKTVNFFGSLSKRRIKELTGKEPVQVRHFYVKHYVKCEDVRKNIDDSVKVEIETRNKGE